MATEFSRTPDASGAAVNDGSLCVSRLAIGEPLDQDLFDSTGVKLLGAGTRITSGFVEALKARGIRSVSTQPKPERSAASAPSVQPEQMSGKGCASKTTSGTPAFAHAATDAGGDGEAAYRLEGRPRPPKVRLDPDAFESATQHAVAHAARAMDAWDTKGQRLLGASRIDTSDVLFGEQLLADVLPTMLADVDLSSVMLALGPGGRHPLLEHGVRTALAAMHLAYHVGYPKEKVVHAGLAGLLADVGMGRVPEALRHTDRRYTADDWLTIRRHPGYSADLLEDTDTPKDVRMAVYQHHERLDGSGYPHGRKGFFLHPLSRLVAVADVYAALAEPREHRPAQSAHHAVRAVLEGVKAQQLDGRLGKVLLNTVSLFPVGTAMSLRGVRGDQDVAARVIRTIDDAPARPYVTLLDASGEPTGKKVDLSVRDEVSIARVWSPIGSTAQAA